MKSCSGSSELIFKVLNFVTPEARYANDARYTNGRKFSWVEYFVTRGIVMKIMKISTPPKLPAIRYINSWRVSVFMQNKCSG